MWPPILNEERVAMPNHIPDPAGSHAQDGAGAPPVEYLSDHGATAKRGGRRTALVAAVTATVVGAAAVGTWAVAQFMSGGPAPAMAVPGDAFAYISLDLDPDGGQKIEALRTLRKFPVIRDDLGIEEGSDLRKVLFEAIAADTPCAELDFDDDIDPWLGGKLGVAVVPGDSEPVPLFVLQVKDVDLAREGMGQLTECAEGEAPGIGFVEDFMVVAEDEDVAEQLVADAEAGSLADDGEFQRWIDEAGGSGIIEGYVSADAPQYFADELQMPATHDMGGASTGSANIVGAASAPRTVTAPPGFTEMFEEFDGAALVLRFDDEALEVEVAAGGLPAQLDSAGDSGVEDLPATTALALGFSVADGAVEDMVENFLASSGMGADELDELFAEAEAQTGLELPEDLQTLLGDGVSVAVDSSLDVEAFVESTGDPSDIPAGVRIVGDPDEITEVIDKLLAAAGPVATDVVVTRGDGVVAVGIDADYVATLAEDGALGDQDRFQAALEDVDRANGALYVDFDAGDWLTELAATDADERIEENVEPLDSLGVGGWLEDDVMHGLVRLTTD